MFGCKHTLGCNREVEGLDIARLPDRLVNTKLKEGPLSNIKFNFKVYRRWPWPILIIADRRKPVTFRSA